MGTISWKQLDIYVLKLPCDTATSELHEHFHFINHCDLRWEGSSVVS